MYQEEHTLHNHFEVDVDVQVPATDTEQLAFIDYTIIRDAVAAAFEQPYEMLEQFIHDIYTSLKEKLPESEKIKITIRKKNPPMPGQVDHAQVAYEG